MSFHGNSKKNTKVHHLYLVHDTEENDIFKYGISDKPIGNDGYSRRMREQIDYLNRAVGWARYAAEILILDIPGRTRARQIEDEYINAYYEKYGRNPRGNAD
ncbi:MAG TPA: hypothetical protein PK228_19290 [Saprospiraceae bacterium]|nr:hypothetical protein [Saprospiraceae bacterium]